jgi:respiratory nitrate reductase gamma subunit
MNALFRLVALPYAAVAIALLGALRLASSDARRAALRPSAEDRSSWEAVPFHLGLLVVLGGHVMGALAPGWVARWSADPTRLLAAEVVSLAGGLVALVAILGVCWRRVVTPALRAVTSRADLAVFVLLVAQLSVGVALAARHRWGSAWYAQVVVPYLRSLAVLAPEVGSVPGLPPLFQVHATLGFVLVAIVPFTRLAHVLTGPRVTRGVGALARRARAVAVAAAALLACGPSSSSRPGYEPAQPIAFSHAAHAGAYRIDCQYCHYVADVGRLAGLPPFSVCMNCHARVHTDSAEIAKVARAAAGIETVRWTRVHRLPAFVYFDHARHTRAGVRCGTCHGAVETMARVRQESELTMGWCLECHRNPLAVSAAPAQAAPTGAAVSEVEAPRPPNTLTDCTTCHR